MTALDRLFESEQERRDTERRTVFNQKHGHGPDCEFVVDDWVCLDECVGSLW